MTVGELVLAAGAFLSGSLPLAVWIGRYGPGGDPRDYGDGNPGAFNVLRASGPLWGGLAVFLDIFKGALPVGLAAYVFEIEGLALVLIAIAPVLGHAFSPFLKFNGGKGIATSAGIWIGLTIWTVPLVGIATLTTAYLALTSSAWAVVVTIGAVIAFLLLTGASTTLLAVAVLNAALLIYRHRGEFDERPALRAFSRREANDTP